MKESITTFSYIAQIFLHFCFYSKTQKTMEPPNSESRHHKVKNDIQNGNSKYVSEFLGQGSSNKA